jgi:hypothetical protein
VVAEANKAGIILPKNDFKNAASNLYKWITNEEGLLEAQTRALSLGKNYFDLQQLADDLNKILEEAAINPSKIRQTNIGRQYSALWNKFFLKNG